MAENSDIEWRTCGACDNHYQGPFGECPKCMNTSSKKARGVGGNTGSKRTQPTLDTQEGNFDG